MNHLKSKNITPFLVLDIAEKKSTSSKRYDLTRQEIVVNYPYNNFVGVNNQYVFVATACPDIQKQRMISSVICYNLQNQTTLAGRLKYTSDQLARMNGELLEHFNEDDRTFFYPYTISEDSRQLIAVVKPNSDDNPVLIFATLKRLKNNPQANDVMNISLGISFV